jgi:hypothetical protein
MRPIGVADCSWSVVDVLLAHVPPLPSSCVQVAVTGTAPDFSEKKTTPHGPGFMSPWGPITIAPGGIENLTLPSSTTVSLKSAVSWIVWVAISRLLLRSSRSDAEKVGWPATAAEHGGADTWPRLCDVAPRPTAISARTRTRGRVTESMIVAHPECVNVRAPTRLCEWRPERS